MTQTYCRPVEGVEILSITQGAHGLRITLKTKDGISIVGPEIMVHLRGEDVVRAGWGPDGWGWQRVVSDLKDDELLIDEQGVVREVT